MLINCKKTREVARDAGCAPSHITYFLRAGKLAPPQKDASGDYCWSESDIDALRRLLLACRRKGTVAAKE